MSQTARTRREASDRRQVNVRVDARLYRALEAVARQERRSMAQAVCHLIERGLRLRADDGIPDDDLPAGQLVALAQAGRAFDWLDEEPDLYGETSGEPM